MVNVFDGPTQVPPFVDGVTVIVATTGDPLALTATNGAMLPVPLAGKPIEGALFVQL